MTQAMLDRFLLNCAKMCLDKMVVSTSNLMNHLAYETHNQTLPKDFVVKHIYFKHLHVGKTILKIKIAKFHFYFLKMQKQYCHKHKNICTMDWDGTKRWIVTFLRLSDAYTRLIKHTPYAVFLNTQ